VMIAAIVLSQDATSGHDAKIAAWPYLATICACILLNV